jgi:hypothetical protein
LGRSVIVEGEAHADQKEGDGVDPDSVRGCAFNSAGVDENEKTSMAQSKRIGGVRWGLLVCGALGVVLVAG